MKIEEYRRMNITLEFGGAPIEGKVFPDFLMLFAISCVTMT